MKNIAKFVCIVLLCLCVFKSNAQDGMSILTPLNIGTLEYGDSFSDQEYNGNFNNFIGEPSSEIYYSFTLDHPLKINISVTGSDVQAVAHLLDINGNDIIPEAGTLSYDLGPGTYYIASEGMWYNTGNILTSVTATAQNGSSYNLPIDVGLISATSSFSDVLDNSLPGFTNQGYMNSNEIWHRFTIDHTMIVNISLCGTSFDTYVHLWNGSTLQEITSGDNTGPICTGSAASISMVLSPGSYLVASEGGDFDYGNITTNISGTDLVYGISTQLPINIGYMDSGTYTDTKNNSSSNGFSNLMGQPSNDIYYSFSVGHNSKVSISLLGSSVLGNIHLLDLNGVEIAAGDISGPLCTGVNASLVTTLLPGNYYIMVEGNGANIGDITTSLNVISYPGSTYNDPIGLPTLEHCSTGGTFAETRYIDTNNGYANGVYYYFSIIVPSTVSISNCGSGIQNTYMQLNGATNNSGYGTLCATPQASMQLTLQPGGYILLCRGANFESGNITTTINAVPLPAPPLPGQDRSSAQNLGTLTAGITLSGSYTPSDCYEPAGSQLYQKYYKFHLNNSTTVTISNCNTQDGGYFLNLLDNTGSLLASNTWGLGNNLSPCGYAAASIITTLSQGDYYVTVPSYNVYFWTINTTISVTNTANLCNSSAVRYGPLTSIPTAPINTSTADILRNWTMTTSYDDDGNVIAENKSYFDDTGKPVQSQVKSESTGHVLATQTIYDAHGRPVINTLPAPINSANFVYKDNFVTNSSYSWTTNAYGNYDYTNFDGDPLNTSNPYAKLNNPDAVSNIQPGTLGWYYSDNNTYDPMVATTNFPYARVDYYNDGTGATKRSANVGDALVMGQGHETSTVGFPVLNELDNYLLIRNHFFSSTSLGGVPINMAGKALQNISTDPNGLQALTVTDLAGKALMTGRADASGNAWLSINNAVNLDPSPNDYEVTINTNGKSTNNTFPVNTFSLKSSNVVTITKDGAQIWNDIGSNFVFDSTSDPNGGAGSTYIVRSSMPFYYSEYAFVIPLIDPNVTLVDDAKANVAESASTSIHYFKLTKAQNITINGSYQLFEMKSETDITGSFINGGVLPAGYYKIMATPGYINGAITPVTFSYSNSYSDISYNYYNQLGQLVASIAPNGVKQLIDAINSNTLNSISSIPYATTYEYDVQGRLIAATSADGGRSEFIYRKDGKMRFSQNALQRSAAGHTTYAEKFSYINYDDIGRPVESGEYVIPVGAALVFSSFSGNDALLENVDPANNMLPTGTSQDWVKTHYDMADPNMPNPGNYIQDEGFLKGAVSWTENPNAKTWYNYDDQGRTTWTIKQITGLGNKTIDYTYDSKGHVIKIDYQQNTASERFVHHYGYNADGRLVNVATSRDGVTDIKQQAEYYYYLNGALKRVELGDRVQGIDYVYTPQGWLKSINNPSGDPTKDPNQDGVTNGFAPDAFSMQLEYFPNDYARSGSNISNINSGQQVYYNGNINGISWQSNKPQSALNTSGIQSPVMYSYSYDPKYQLANATWGVPNFANQTFTNGNMFSETVSGYDYNGNITGIVRNDVNGVVRDNFNNYQYQANTNMLSSVGTVGNATSYATYAYDELGRLKSEVKTGGDTYNLAYDISGKITGIYDASNQLKVSFTYDENGSRISRTDATGTTYYVYDSSGNTIAIYNGTTLTELPFYGADKLGVYTLANNNYVYELKDNVGSVRVVLNRDKSSTCTADIVKYDDYYPYGTVAQSAGTGYRYEYQGAYAEKDPVTGLNNFELRMYDAAIGRWISVDPMRQFASPYEGMGNNPVKGIDPTGGYDPPDWVQLADGSVVNDPKVTQNTDGTINNLPDGATYIGVSKVFSNDYLGTRFLAPDGHEYSTVWLNEVKVNEHTDEGMTPYKTLTMTNAYGLGASGSILLRLQKFGRLAEGGAKDLERLTNLSVGISAIGLINDARSGYNGNPNAKYAFVKDAAVLVVGIFVPEVAILDGILDQTGVYDKISKWNDDRLSGYVIDASRIK